MATAPKTAVSPILLSSNVRALLASLLWSLSPLTCFKVGVNSLISSFSFGVNGVRLTAWLFVFVLVVALCRLMSSLLGFSTVGVYLSVVKVVVAGASTLLAETCIMPIAGNLSNYLGWLLFSGTSCGRS